jgi:hypothetical protein
MPVAGWLNVDGLQPLVVWHWAQSVSPPCCAPWQLTQARPGALRPLVWQRSQGKAACTPFRATGWVKWLAQDDVVWQRGHVPRSGCGRW